jgi:hypothetical protein
VHYGDRYGADRCCFPWLQIAKKGEDRRYYDQTYSGQNQFQVLQGIFHKNETYSG